MFIISQKIDGGKVHIVIFLCSFFIGPVPLKMPQPNGFAGEKTRAESSAGARLLY